MFRQKSKNNFFSNFFSLIFWLLFANLAAQSSAMTYSTLTFRKEKERRRYKRKHTILYFLLFELILSNWHWQIWFIINENCQIKLTHFIHLKWVIINWSTQKNETDLMKENVPVRHKKLCWKNLTSYHILGSPDNLCNI